MLSNTFLQKQHLQFGFTLVEMLVVIAVIGTLAGIVLVSLGDSRDDAVDAALRSDLKNAADAYDIATYKGGNYPVGLPSSVRASSGVVLQAANTGSNSSFCVNAVSTNNPKIRRSYSSMEKKVQEGLCDGIPVGGIVGGTMPTAPRNFNIANDFPRWPTSGYTGGAAYYPASNVMSLFINGTATSALIKVDKPSTIKVGGDFYTSSAANLYAPNGGWSVTIYYFGADGATPAANSLGSISNDCSQSTPVSSIWNKNDVRCSFTGGPNVEYITIKYKGSGISGYSSPNLNVRSPQVLTQ